VEKAMGLLFKIVGRLSSFTFRAFAGIVVLFLLSSCSLAPAPNASTWMQRRALLDFTGLKPLESIDSVKVTGAPPVGWERLPTKKTALYTHEQWRSPSTRTGVGVAYLRMPLPLGAGAIAWFAKQEYGKKADDGRILGEWTDSFGRSWFEVENKKYHVRGYVITRGLDAWIIYSGYRLTSTPETADIALAMRSAETVVPIANNPTPTTQPQLAQK
jgi:hypothetical protein